MFGELVQRLFHVVFSSSSKCLFGLCASAGFLHAQKMSGFVAETCTKNGCLNKFIFEFVKLNTGDHDCCPGCCCVVQNKHDFRRVGCCWKHHNSVSDFSPSLC